MGAGWKAILWGLVAVIVLTACAGDNGGGGGMAGAAGNTDGPSGQAGGNGLPAVGSPAMTADGAMQPGAGGAEADGDAAAPSDACAEIDVTGSRATPRVLLVVDGSGSMMETFGSGTRWTELSAALVDPDMGLVTQLEASVAFGLTIYQRQEMATCPLLTEVPIALNSYKAIDTALQMVMPNGATPTGEALAAIVGKLPDLSTMPNADPYLIVLATDGMPNGCAAIPPSVLMMCPPVPSPIPGQPAGPDPFCIAMALQNLPPDYQGTLDATRAAQAKGVQLYVISLAPDLQVEAELQRVANLGAGLSEDASPGAEIFEPSDTGALRDALARIVGGAVGCTMELDGVVLEPARACDVEVTVDGDRLACDGADGWRAVDATHIELLGAACDHFQSDPGAKVHASFPCTSLAKP